MSTDDDFPHDTPWIVAPKQAIKGRGALTNIAGRFDTQIKETVDDGWQQSDDEALAPLRTEVTLETAKSIISRNASPDLPFNASLNPYRGCEHGCIYCFARPSHSYLGLSPGLDFETRLFAKTNAADLLRRELAAPHYQPEAIALGVNTDAYQPCERQLQLTRQVLEVFLECEHPVGVITKSSMIERDIDVLSALAERQLTVASLTITTLDHSLSRHLEPRAASPTRRLQTIERLANAGIPVSVNVAPIIPFVTDQDLEKILEAAANAGASGAGYTMLRLPWEVKPLFEEWLQAHFPERADRVMARLQELNGGEAYNAKFGERMRGQGVWAALIAQRFEHACRRFGIGRNDRFRGMTIEHFRKPRSIPVASENHKGQVDMFGG